jgi:hypothetical protein
MCTFGSPSHKVVLGGGDTESYDVGEPFTLLIDGSAETDALADPAPVAAKAEVVATAADGIIDTRGKSVARIMFGGTDAENEATNYQVIAWSQVLQGASEGWVPRVVAKGLATFGADVYAITGFGAATNFFADTITDTILDKATIFQVADQRAVLEVPTFGAERIEVQTDRTTAATVDCLIQLSDAPSSGGSGSFFGHFEDEAHVSGDPGNMFLAVRTDSRASLAGTTGDYAPLQLTANGDVRVKDDDANTVLGTIDADTGAIKTATELADDVVHAEDEQYTAADKGTGILAVRKDTEAQAGSAADGDYVPLQTDSTGSLRVTDDSANTSLTAAAADLALIEAPTEKTPVIFSQTATSGTQAAIVGSETFVRAVYMQAKKVSGDNTGNVFVGTSTVSVGDAELFELTPGATFELPMPLGFKVDLNDVYIDVDTTGDGVVGWYIPV